MTIALSPVAPNSIPIDDDVAKFDADLPSDQCRRFAYATGYLGGLIRSIAEVHRRCRRHDCMTCWHLRRGLALVAALDRAEHAATGGDR